MSVVDIRERLAAKAKPPGPTPAELLVDAVRQIRALGYDDMEIMRMLAATIEFVPQPNWARRGPPLLADQLAYDRIVHRCSPFRVPNSRKQANARD
jgi:hypothetical protein